MMTALAGKRMSLTVVFDFFGVIGSEAYDGWLADTIPDIKKRLPVFRSFADKVDRGEYTLSEFLDKVAAEAGVSPSGVRSGVESRMAVNADMVALVDVVRKNHRTGLLSNAAHEWLEMVLDDHGLWDRFDEVIISSKVGLIKPEPAMFEYLRDRLDVPYDQIVFVDDRAVNADAASALGIKGVHYQDIESLRLDLRRLGVMV